MWGFSNLLMFSAILIFKKPEDYIALYSQNKTQKLVSIYQRRIIDEMGTIDKGITTKINDLLKMRRQSAKSFGTNR